MNKFAMFAGAAGAAVLFSGCGPDLAQVDYGKKEAGWQEVFRDNYSGYEAPRTAPPAVVDNVSPRLIEEEQRSKAQRDDAAADAPAVSDDPAATVDKAANDKADDKKADDKKADGKKADDKKADGKKADDKKAEDKKADGKKADADKKDAGKKADDAKAGNFDIYEVVAGDNLGKIAKKFYGDARCYDIILNANKPLKDNPDKLRVGMKLVIPKI